MSNYNGLEKLNIERLFSSKGIKPITGGNIDIQTLFQKKSQGENFTLDTSVLLSNVIKKRKKVNECYGNIFRSCCDTIISANNSDLVDIIFEIPSYIPDCLEYNICDCLNFIKDRLSKDNISFLTLNKTKLFITWKTLLSEENIDKNNDKNSDQD